MVTVERLEQLQPHVGRELGVGDWITVTQPMIDGFGTLTGDRHWIHVDPERARREGGFGTTIAQGFFTVSMLTQQLAGCFQVTGAKRWLNYGLDRLRFTAPVRAGARVRLRLVLAALEPLPDQGTRLRCRCTVELEGSERPALVCDYLMLAYE